MTCPIPPIPNNQSCPNCGRCPTCGRPYPSINITPTPTKPQPVPWPVQPWPQHPPYTWCTNPTARPAFDVVVFNTQ